MRDVGIGEVRPEVRPRRALHETGERRDEEDEQPDDRERDDERRRADAGGPPAPRAHGARKPYCSCSSVSVALDVTKSTHASASAAFLASFNAAIGSVATTF